MLLEKFSAEEQASLVWQFLCSIPVNMMAEFLPWLSSSVSPDEYQDLRKCLTKVVPEEKLLQQVRFDLYLLHLCFFIIIFRVEDLTRVIA